MSHRAEGTFDVKVVPTSEGRALPGFGRMTIDKTFHGDLEGTSAGEMLTAGDPGKGSAGYVALERVEGILSGKHGSFFLQQNATMHAGTQELQITIVPGSGTEDFVGISGTFEIAIDAAGAHSYTLEYALPE